MRKECSFGSLPWSVPVPVVPGDFVPAHPELNKFNVVVDNSRVPSFIRRPIEIPEDDLLHCDLQRQTRPARSYEKILGSGRAGHFKGKWLKGVGRTPLAYNWNLRENISYCSGSLPASAAFRERVATVFARARGIAHTINGCEGLLLRRRPDESPDTFKRTSRLLPVDRRFEALSVKPGNFARLSNFSWVLSQPITDRSLAPFFRLLDHFLDPGEKLSVADLLEPDVLVGKLGDAFERGKNYQKTYFVHGLLWGGAGNNCALDGRFLDLEAPVIIGAPFVGFLGRHGGDELFHLGFESLTYFLEFAQFLRFLRGTLNDLCETECALDLPSRIYAKVFLQTLRGRAAKARLPEVDGGSLRASWVSWFLEFATEELKIPRRSKANFEAWVASIAREFEERGMTGGSHVRLAKAPFRIVPRGGASVDLYVPRFVHLTAQSLSDGQEVNECLRSLDKNATSEKALFDLLAGSEKRIDSMGRAMGKSGSH